MKRRLKLTPFAKIFIAALIIVGARYAYNNYGDKTKNGFVDIFNSEEKEKTDAETDGSVNKKQDETDSLVFYVSKNAEIFTIKVDGKSININFEDTVTEKDTFIFDISGKEKLKGVVIVEK